MDSKTMRGVFKSMYKYFKCDLHVVVNNAAALRIRSLNLYGINMNIFRHKAFMVTYFKNILL